MASHTSDIVPAGFFTRCQSEQNWFDIAIWEYVLSREQAWLRMRCADMFAFNSRFSYSDLNLTLAALMHQSITVPLSAAARTESLYSPPSL